MKLIHWSGKPFKLKDVSKLPRSSTWHERLLYHKPTGLWVSDEDDYGWKEWSEDNGFRLDKIQTATEITLKPEANILYLRTVQDIDDFSKQWAYKKSEINKHMQEAVDQEWIMEIDWPKLAKHYQGIIITPYQWSRRLMGGAQWYYGWDCASGCIWDVSAIKSTRVISKVKK